MKSILLTVLMLSVVSVFAMAQEASDYCASASECSDGNECTVDYCGTSVNMLESGMMEITAGNCQFTKAPDGTKCSIGKCSNGFCTRVRVPNARGHSTSSSPASSGSESVEEAQVVFSAESVPVLPDNSVPEFSTVAAGLAFASAGMGYMLLRRMK